MREPGAAFHAILLPLLEFRVVLGAVLTTPDGLIVSHVGLDQEDAELLAALSVARQITTYTSLSLGPGRLHTLPGTYVRLVVLTEADAPDNLQEMLEDHLRQVEDAISV